MADLAGRIDVALVQRARGRGASWDATARMVGVPTDSLRRYCDPTYAPPDLSEAAARAPKLASGREARAIVWDPPCVEVRAVPPCSNARALPREAAPSHRQEEIVSATPNVRFMPTAQEVALAVAAAARALSEDPRRVFDANTIAGRRHRFAAFVALRARFPGCPVSAVGRMTGILTNHSTCVAKAQGASWWPVSGEAAAEAAIAALDRGALQ